MAADREELEGLRRLAELEARDTPNPASPPPQQMSPMQARMGIRGTRSGQGSETLLPNVWDTISNLGYNVGGGVTDLTGSPKAGYLANIATDALPMLASSVVGAASKIPSIGEGLAKWMMTKAVKPSTEDIVNKSADKAFSTMLKEGQLPTQGGMIKAQKIVNEMHPQVQAGIEKSSAEIPIDPIGQGYLEQYTKAIPQGESAIKDVTDTWKNFSTNPAIAGSDSMTAPMADVMKRGAQQNARANYGKPSGDAEKALAALLREELLKGVPEIRAPLAREASNMNVLDVARNSIAQQSKNNPAGLAALRADQALPMLGFLADRSPAIKGMLAHMLYQGGRPEVALPSAAAAARIPELFKQE